MTISVGMTPAKARLADLVRGADEEPVELTKHGRPVAYLISARRYQELLDRLEDYEDRLYAHERDPNEPALAWDDVVATLKRVDAGEVVVDQGPVRRAGKDVVVNDRGTPVRGGKASTGAVLSPARKSHKKVL